MASNILQIGLTKGLGSVVSNYQQGVDAKDARSTARSEARFRQTQMDEQLRQQGLAKESGIDEQKLQEALAASKASENKVSRLETYNYLDAYSIDSNPKHLNSAIRAVPTMKRMLEIGFGGEIASIQSLDMASPRDMQLLSKEEDLSMEELTGPDMDTKNLQSRFVKVIGVDGSERIMDVAQDLYATTGYFRYKDELSQTKMLNQMKVDKVAKSGNAPGELEKTARFVSKTTGKDLSTTTEQLFQDKIAGNIIGQQRVARGKEDSILQAAGIDPSEPGKLGEFLQVDMTDPNVREKFTSLVPELERLSQEELSDRQKDDLEKITASISSAQSASDLEEPSTGFVDKQVDAVKAYIEEELDNDSVAQKQARNAYFSLRNVLRNAIAGASLTNAEITAFNEAFGTLNQQLPQVLSGLVVQLRQTKGQLDGIASSGNPYAMHYRLGGTRQNLDKIINTIDGRLAQPESEEDQIGSFFGTVGD